MCQVVGILCIRSLKKSGFIESDERKLLLSYQGSPSVTQYRKQTNGESLADLFEVADSPKHLPQLTLVSVCNSNQDKLHLQVLTLNVARI